MTGTGTTPHQGTEDTSTRATGTQTLRRLLAASWQATVGGQPPTQWLEHTTNNLAGHLAETTRTPTTDQAGAATPVHAELALLRQCIREQLAGAVAGEQIDFEVATGMLATCGLPPLLRHYTVHLRVPFTVHVAAEDDDTAFDSACDAVADAFTPESDQITPAWDHTENDGTYPGDADTDQPPDSPAAW